MTTYKDATGKPIDCLYRFSRKLVGLTRRNRLGESRMEVARQLQIGTPLLLLRESDNLLDRNAVLVYRADDPSRDLGYMEARGARHFCPLVERGAVFDAQVCWLNRESPEHLEVFMYLFQLTKPN